MALNFFDTVRGSTIALAASALVSACGGGGGGNGDEPTQASSTSISGGSNAVGAVSGGTGTNTDTGIVTSASGDSGASTSGGTTSTTTSIDASTTDTSQSNGGTSTTSTTSSDDGSTTVASANASPTTLIGATHITAKSSLGLNLGTLDYYSPSMPTIDLMKKGSAWLTQCNPYVAGSTCKNLTGGASAFDTLEEASIDLDADGWPRSLPASSDATHKFRSVATIILSGGWQQAGEYIVRYDGAGTLGYNGVATRNASKSTAGRDVIQVVNTSGAGLTLSITATTPGNYLRNVRVYPPGGACANDLTTYAASAAACTGATGAYVPFENFPSTSIWHPMLLAELKGFRTARFMDWMHTNSSTVSDWSQRTVATWRSWNTPAGVPIEKIVALANAAGIDPWVNVPTHATDDYVAQFAKVLHQQLSPSQSVNVEYSNEPWNYSFPGTNWMYAQGQAAWPAEVAAKTSPFTLQANWYANRLVQVCTIIKNEFGADKSRVRCIANTQAASVGSATAVLNCTVAAKTTGQACGKSIDVLSIAPYFGGYISATKLRPTVASWYTATDGGLTPLFNEIMGSEAPSAAVAPLAVVGSNVATGSLAQVKGWMVANKAVADQFHIPLWAYEGGQGLAPPGGDTDATLVTLFTNANRDPRMAAAYARMLADWQAAGGQTFSLYADIGTPSKYGMWGLKENVFDTNSVKWTAVTKFRDAVTCWWSGC